MDACSTPHLAIDPLMIVNTLYMMLNNLTSKIVDPFEAAVLTIGKCGGGTAANIIPDTAVLEGGLRCYNLKVRDNTIKRVHEIIDSVIYTMQGSYTICCRSAADRNGRFLLYQSKRTHHVHVFGRRQERQLSPA